MLDTNIILDYLCANRPEHRSAVDALEAIYEEPGCMPMVLLATLKDAYCIMNRVYHNEPVVRQRLQDFAEVVELAELTTPIVRAAFASDEPDFEDAIVRVSAERMGARAILTRDADAYKHSHVPSMDARAYARQFATCDSAL